MKKTLTLTYSIFAALLLCLISSSQSFGQTIYSQSFDSINTLPSGWYATDTSWYVDSTAGNSSNGGEGTYVGASGANNLAIANASAPFANDSLITNSISTTAFTNINVDWGCRFSMHFADSGSQIVGFYWSPDNGTTWNRINYAENINTSLWSWDNNGNSISLPSGTAGLASLKFLWVANIKSNGGHGSNGSGTYRIDDFTVSQGSFSAISTVGNPTDEFAYVYLINSTSINIALRHSLSEKVNVELYDVSGKVIQRTVMTSNTLSLDGSSLSGGIYFVRLNTGSDNMVNKIFIK